MVAGRCINTYIYIQYMILYTFPVLLVLSSFPDSKHPPGRIDHSYRSSQSYCVWKTKAKASHKTKKRTLRFLYRKRFTISRFVYKNAWVK